jgi:hypothetical protein
MPKQLITAIILFLITVSPLFAIEREKIEQWGCYEIRLTGPSEGNPFKNVDLSAVFTDGFREHRVKGFYNGSGNYLVRFMPESTGMWSYATVSNIKILDNRKGQFECVLPSENNHGKVRVNNTYHFQYDDGTAYYPFGTTCYAWIHQEDSLQLQTLATLAQSPFNKIRMFVFPKRLWFNDNEPLLYPYTGTPPDKWDFSRFNPSFFNHLEKRIKNLMELGIECDLILFHPYDEGHWGFDRMKDEEDDFYLRYLIARLSAFRNIWWSLGNEYDLMDGKTTEDWDRFFQILQSEDPYGHLRSVHNWRTWYDYTKPWVTHLSLQASPKMVREWREKYKKPVIVDEFRYEGNIRYSWGDLTAEECTRRFWDAVTKGGYASHGETYLHKKNILWWAKGGVLHGQSPSRIAFLKEIIEGLPNGGLTPFTDTPLEWNRSNGVKINDDVFLVYYGNSQPGEREIMLPDKEEYTIEIIDTLNMTVTMLDGSYSGRTLVKLPGCPYVAVRAIKKNKTF